MHTQPGSFPSLPPVTDSRVSRLTFAIHLTWTIQPRNTATIRVQPLISYARPPPSISGLATAQIAHENHPFCNAQSVPSLFAREARLCSAHTTLTTRHHLLDICMCSRQSLALFGVPQFRNLARIDQIWCMYAPLGVLPRFCIALRNTNTAPALPFFVFVLRSLDSLVRATLSFYTRS